MLAFWSTAEWASVVSAVGAAIAAIASWATIFLDHRRKEEAIRPNVSAGFGVTRDLVGRIVFANGGPGLAIQLAYIGVDDDGKGPARYFGLVGNGFQQPGSEETVMVGRVPSRSGEAHLVWICRDVENNMHVRGYDGSYRRISAKDYLDREHPSNLTDYFALVYPDIPMPQRNFGQP